MVLYIIVPFGTVSASLCAVVKLLATIHAKSVAGSRVRSASESSFVDITVLI